jgi:scyllo-inositol 2-dehydrogenase (NADP+)
VALIGCGGFAQLYHVPALLSDSRVELVFVCDPAPTQAILDITTRAKAIFTREVDVVWRGGCDAVIISTPHSLHAQQVREALAHKCHVLVDKPFVLTSGDASELADLARRSERVAAVAFNRRFDPACLRARELVNGRIGQICLVETVQLGYPSGGWMSDNPALAGGGPVRSCPNHWRLSKRPEKFFR